MYVMVANQNFRSVDLHQCGKKLPKEKKKHECSLLGELSISIRSKFSRKNLPAGHYLYMFISTLFSVLL